MHKNIATWERSCIDCQSSKINRHTHIKPSNFVARVKIKSKTSPSTLRKKSALKAPTITRGNSKNKNSNYIPDFENEQKSSANRQRTRPANLRQKPKRDTLRIDRCVENRN